MKNFVSILLATLTILLFCSDSQAQGWYMIDSGECVAASDSHAGFLCQAGIGEYHSPSDFIKQYKEHMCGMICDISYSDVREGGKVVQVNINYCTCHYRGSECSITFYRLERCKTIASRGKEIQRKEQKRLKEYE
jgi:hypothetical protein